METERATLGRHLLAAPSFVVLLVLAGCGTIPVPTTLGDQGEAPAFGYTPLDPLPVVVKYDNGGRQPTNQQKLDFLPDETMRLAIGKFQASGSVTYGPLSVASAGSSYLVVLDYVKFTTKQLPLVLVRGESATTEGAEVLYRVNTTSESPDVVMPVYVGVGLRMTATVQVIEGTVNLANLVAVGAAVKSGNATGTLVIQTLGLSGEGVSTSIPIPTELNETTVANALMAMGAIKAKTYDPKTLVTPRVLGIYNTVGGDQETVNGLVSALLQEPVVMDLGLPEEKVQ